MGVVYADITLINAGDLEMAKRHIIGEDEVKQMTVRMLVDSGAYMMGINETIQEQLNLSFIEKRKAMLADGSVQDTDLTEAININDHIMIGELEGRCIHQSFASSKITTGLFKYFDHMASAIGILESYFFASAVIAPSINDDLIIPAAVDRYRRSSVRRKHNYSH